MRAIGCYAHAIIGIRVDSVTRPRTTARQYDFPSRASRETREMAEAIPYWPETIRYTDLEKITGMTKNSIVSRISACHGDYKIFTDRGRLSRLMPDLSNCIYKEQ